MTIYKTDFPLIKRAVVIFLSLLSFGIMAVAASTEFVAQARLDYLDARRKINLARTRLDQTNRDMQDRKSYAAEYDELLRRNIIGNDRRPDWVKELEKIRSRNLVPDFRYSISPQQTYRPPSPLESGNFDLHLNRMSIRLDLLHEGQLLAFLEALRSDINGCFVLDHCSIERTRIEPINASDPAPSATSNSTALQRNPPNLQAECTGGWLTMNNRTAP